MKHSQKSFILPIVIVIIAIIAIGGGAYYYSQKNVQQGLDTQANTTGWQTFTDTKFGYSLKYPSGYTVYKYTPPCGSSLDNLNGQNVRIWIDSMLKNDKSQYQQDLKNNKIIDFDVNINDPEDKCVSAHYSWHVEIGTKGYKLLKSENTIINGYKVLRRDYIDTDIPEEGKAFNFSTYRFEKNGNYFTLLYNDGVTVDLEKGKDIFKSFLNSFKFAN